MIVCGAEESFHNFIEQLRRCDPMRPPVVILHPKLPHSWSLLQSMFNPLHFVQVTPLAPPLLPTPTRSFLLLTNCPSAPPPPLPPPCRAPSLLLALLATPFWSHQRLHGESLNPNRLHALSYFQLCTHVHKTLQHVYRTGTQPSH